MAFDGPHLVARMKWLLIRFSLYEFIQVLLMVQKSEYTHRKGLLIQG